MKILIAGCGYVGSVLGSELASAGHEVWGLCRDPSGLPHGVRPLRADLFSLESLGAIPEGLDHVVYCAAPGLRGATRDDDLRDAYRAIYLDGFDNLLRALSDLGETPERVFFTSSTSVYGQRRGEWVDETSSTKPERFTGDMLLLAEGLLRGSPFPGTSVRFGGIYGPRRTRLLERVRSGQAQWRSGGPHYTNRIHRDDAAGVLRHLIESSTAEALVLGVDSDPVDERALYEWLAERLAAPMPVASEGGGASSRGPGSKRCSNARLLASGYEFRYPSFREGYGELIDAPAKESA
jgi:nucleoside-diphosphate-sugar epimerase